MQGVFDPQMTQMDTDFFLTPHSSVSVDSKSDFYPQISQISADFFQANP